jgi:hypothetical protein
MLELNMNIPRGNSVGTGGNFGGWGEGKIEINPRDRLNGLNGLNGG